MAKHFENNIKNMKPKKNGKYHQGYVPESLCKKLFRSCTNEPIIYRSSLEYQFILFCENSPKVKQWASEPIAIKYYNKLTNKEQNYYPDYVVELNDGTKIIVEIKPYSQTKKPSASDSRWLKEAWIVNTEKWKSAYEFAHKNNAKFIIVTEKFFETI